MAIEYIEFYGESLPPAPPATTVTETAQPALAQQARIEAADGIFIAGVPLVIGAFAFFGYLSGRHVRRGEGPNN